MSEVTDIREARGGMVEIYLGGVRAISIRKKHFDKVPVKKSDEIDLNEYVDRVAAAQFSDAYEAALTSLDAAERTRSEIVKSLLRRGYVKPVADAVAEKLTDIGLVDDIRYAKRMAQSAAKKPVGAMNIKRKLMAKGLSRDDAEEIIADELDENQQREACKKATEKLGAKYASLPLREAKGKLSQALARRGFTWDAVSSAIEDYFNGQDTDL